MNNTQIDDQIDDASDLPLGVDAVLLSESDALPPLKIQPPPGFLRFFPPLIKQMAEMGVQFTMDQNGTLLVEGFYKNGPLKLDYNHEQLVAIDKRQRVTAIGHFDDLVQLNFRWWRISNSKSNYIVPERPWLDQFIEKRWVKRKVIFEPIDETPVADAEAPDLAN